MEGVIYSPTVVDSKPHELTLLFPNCNKVTLIGDQSLSSQIENLHKILGEPKAESEAIKTAFENHGETGQYPLISLLRTLRYHLNATDFEYSETQPIETLTFKRTSFYEGLRRRPGLAWESCTIHFIPHSALTELLVQDNSQLFRTIDAILVKTSETDTVPNELQQVLQSLKSDSLILSTPSTIQSWFKNPPQKTDLKTVYDTTITLDLSQAKNLIIAPPQPEEKQIEKTPKEKMQTLAENLTKEVTTKKLSINGIPTVINEWESEQNLQKEIPSLWGEFVQDIKVLKNKEPEIVIQTIKGWIEGLYYNDSTSSDKEAAIRVKVFLTHFLMIRILPLLNKDLVELFQPLFYGNHSHLGGKDYYYKLLEKHTTQNTELSKVLQSYSGYKAPRANWDQPSIRVKDVESWINNIKPLSAPPTSSNSWLRSPFWQPSHKTQTPEEKVEQKFASKGPSAST
ncbi:CBU_0425 family Dot/Icm T4SS effector [Coxiella burnetii]|uniref:CBU_0425 family Dot/Icm T4SS effector n=1 Tax=Coxiella burnetii TaxID=777 RepID=UPI0000DAEA6E|nr:CBU_0425 family Dot/Icm T4SS effector [Coxiella burnetii]ABX78700.1 hypothetical protein COXBURSA331_A0532 [Coxiella burnetii RSA 331]ATN81622.1 hypothetical protein AYO24_02445 [Coxiella burnetii]ATN83524.1 hypothetical protein AYO23_02450 [Coxiella burnetii]POZ79686.1 hypothetical protein CbuRSA461_02555 [Coxiella burnetii]